LKLKRNLKATVPQILEIFNQELTFVKIAEIAEKLASFITSAVSFRFLYELDNSFASFTLD